MGKRLWLVPVSVAALALLWGLVPPRAQSSRSIVDVIVSNWPRTQEVEGSVQVEGTIRHSAFHRKEGIIVPTSRRNEISELVPAGTIDADGFTGITVSFQGEVKSTSFESGTIGVLLLPEEEPIFRALRDAKRVQFPVECAVKVANGDSTYFSAEPVHQPVGFPRYKIYCYNTVNKSVEANIYVQLEN